MCQTDASGKKQAFILKPDQFHIFYNLTSVKPQVNIPQPQATSLDLKVEREKEKKLLLVS